MRRTVRSAEMFAKPPRAGAGLAARSLLFLLLAGAVAAATVLGVSSAGKGGPSAAPSTVNAKTVSFTILSRDPLPASDNDYPNPERSDP